MNENMTAFDPEARLVELRAENFVTISTEEYKALIRSATQQEMIHRVTAEAKYSSEIEQVVRITMKMTGWPGEAETDEI